MTSSTSSRATPSDVAFTPSVKAAQARRGSRAMYARIEDGDGWETTVTDDLAAFIADRDSFYLATANAKGQPYIQHRGGPKGFLRVVDDKTLGFVDYAGNRQFITLGNLADNEQAFLFLMDYGHRRRVKIWGRARLVEGDVALQQRLMPAGVKAKPERVILFEIAAWDVNCPQHIPQKVDAEEAREVIAGLRGCIAELERENAVLRGRGDDETRGVEPP